MGGVVGGDVSVEEDEEGGAAARMARVRAAVSSARAEAAPVGFTYTGALGKPVVVGKTGPEERVPALEGGLARVDDRVFSLPRDLGAPLVFSLEISSF